MDNLVTQPEIHYQMTPTTSLSGELQVPGDKSISHRALMFGAIAEGSSNISGLLTGQDNLATMRALQQLGIQIDTLAESDFVVHGKGLQGLTAASHVLDLQNSGTAIRLLTGLLSGQHFDSELTGDDSLRKRPMGRVVNPLNSMGANITMTRDGTAPLKIVGGQSLQGINYKMPMASAQVKSSILLAAMYADGETTIEEPAVTRDHTERMMQQFGYPLKCQGHSISLSGGHSLQPQAIQIPGDISSAAFFIVAASIVPGSDLLLRNVGVNPTRTGIIEILNQMGAKIELTQLRRFGNEPVADIHVRYAPLHGIEIPLHLVPLAIDEFPILFIAAACATDKTILRGAEELRVKESDRLATMSEGLNRLGIITENFYDGLTIEGGVIQGGEINSYKDHRIAMAFAVAGCVAAAPLKVLQCLNVETSFPGFTQLANRIGFRIQDE